MIPDRGWCAWLVTLVRMVICDGDLLKIKASTPSCSKVAQPHKTGKQTKKGGAWGARINTLKHANHLKLNGTYSSRFSQNHFPKQLGGRQRTDSSEAPATLCSIRIENRKKWNRYYGRKKSWYTSFRSLYQAPLPRLFPLHSPSSYSFSLPLLLSSSPRY